MLVTPPEPESNRVTRLRYRKGGEEKVVEEERLAGRVITWWRPCMQLGRRPSPAGLTNRRSIMRSATTNGLKRCLPASDAQQQEAQSTEPASSPSSAQLSPAMACY